MAATPNVEKKKGEDFVSFVEQCLDLIQYEIKDDPSSEAWFEEMRRRCRAYIQNNGTVLTTVEEIVDHLKEGALKTFPSKLREEMTDRVGDILDTCGVHLR